MPANLPDIDSSPLGETSVSGAAMASYSFVEPYMRTVLGFLGVTEVTFLTAGGASALNYGKIDRQTFFQPFVDSIRAQFQPA